MQAQLARTRRAQAQCTGSRGIPVMEVLRLLAPLGAGGPRDGFIADVTCDSRMAVPGSCFIAIDGEKVDGHAFVPAAVRNGASTIILQRPCSIPSHVTAVLVEDTRRAAALLACAFYGKPSEKLDLVGITGTHGKTTTAYMLRHIAEFSGRKAGMLTTVEYDTGVTVVSAPQTTPDPISLNRMLAEAADSGARVMPMEVSSHSLCQHRVTGLKFRAAVFTNLASDHMDYHKTHDAYREAKAKLFDMLSPEAFGILNADDANWKFYASRSRGRTTTYSARDEADVRGFVRHADIRGISFDLACRGRVYCVQLPLPGIHNVENALGAASAALALGIEPEEVAAGLSSFAGVPGRLERIRTDKDIDVFVDFAHTDGSLATVLASIRPYVTGGLIVVFGAGGDRDRGKRPRMARTAQTHADFCILTSDNPRSEDPMQIIAGVEQGFTAKDKYLVRPDRREAIATAVRMAMPGDVVVIAGKGHENGQIFADRVEQFDDREVVREALAN